MSRRLALAVFGLILLSGCARESSTDLCGRRTSLASVTGVLSQGVDAVAAETAGTLRLDILANRNILTAAREQAPDAVQQSIDVVLGAYVALESALDEVDWDLAVAVTDEKVQRAVVTVTSGPALVASATVESYLFAKCGAPVASKDNEVAPATLPPSTQLGTDVTDPATSPPNEESEVTALGLLIGNSFSLTLTVEDATCLGEEISKVVDYSDGTSSSGQYSAQYQRAFDACGIEFDVPA